LSLETILIKSRTSHFYLTVTKLDKRNINFWKRTMQIETIQYEGEINIIGLEATGEDDVKNVLTLHNVQNLTLIVKESQYCLVVSDKTRGPKSVQSSLQSILPDLNGMGIHVEGYILFFTQDTQGSLSVLGEEVVLDFAQCWKQQMKEKHQERVRTKRQLEDQAENERLSKIKKDEEKGLLLQKKIEECLALVKSAVNPIQQTRHIKKLKELTEELEKWKRTKNPNFPPEENSDNTYQKHFQTIEEAIYYHRNKKS
jgi:hypothetical protein